MKKVLFLTSADLMKSYHSGGEHACKNNLKFLQDIYGKENVDVFFFSEWTGELPEQYYTYKRLRRWKAILAQVMGYKMYFPWKERKIINDISLLKPDIVFFDGPLAGNLLSKIPDTIYTVVFEHNFEKKYYYQKMKHEGLIYAAGYFAVSKCERIAVTKCDTLICISERDSRELYREYGRKADTVLPVTFENNFDSKKIVQNNLKELLFIGSNFGPNYDGILWFINHVMTELSEFTLYIVGKNFENCKMELERKNVIVIGTVENLEEYYYRFPVVVIPVLYGSGMKVKTAEAMMYGRTVFATDEALEGYEIDNIEGIYRCNSKSDFINNIQKFYKNVIPSFQKEVYQLYLDKYSYEAGGRIMKKIMTCEKKENL
nr:glycosyltransferase [uncultured Eisenbergiella sp.]